MQQQQRLVSKLIAIPVIFAMIALGWCKSAVAQQDAPKAAEPGGALTIAAAGSATVKAIDPEKRVVTLQTADGETVEIKCGKQVRNFDQIKVGDEVKAAALDRVVVAIGKGPSANAEAATLIARAPQGAKPGAVIARTAEVTAKIDSVDAAKQTVTLSGIDDQPQTIKVAPDVDLSSVKAGDDVQVRLTKGFALWVASPQEAQPAAATDKPAGGGESISAIEGATAIATVESIDAAKRNVTLKAADGSTHTIHLGKECINFDQIQKGDQIRATVAEQVALSVSKGGGPPSAEAAGMVALAPKGAKPGMIIADTDDVTGKITAIDAQKNTFTVQDAEGGTRTIKAGPNVKIADLKEGDDISARVTQAMAIVVAKPG